MAARLSASRTLPNRACEQHDLSQFWSDVRVVTINVPSRPAVDVTVSDELFAALDGLGVDVWWASA